VFVLLEYGLRDGKWEKTLDVEEIKMVSCWNVGTQQVISPGIQRMYSCTKFLNDLGL
jgi:hypothetical protein